MINDYLSKRSCLKGVVVLMDIRHPLKEQDQHLLEWLQGTDLAVQILLTKSDKLSKSERQKTLMQVRQQVSEHFAVSIFSIKEPIGFASFRGFFRGAVWVWLT